MADIYKIGITSRNPYERAQELSEATGVPLPYEVVAAIFVRHAKQAEVHLHDKFSNQRVSISREFFRFTTRDAASVSFRQKVLAMPNQIDPLGAPHEENDTAALVKSLQDINQLESIVARQEIEIQNLKLVNEQQRNQFKKQNDEKLNYMQKTVDKYKQDVTYLRNLIGEIQLYCKLNGLSRAENIYKFIVDANLKDTQRRH